MSWLKLILVLVLAGLPGTGYSHDGASEVVPNSKASSLESCVAPTSDMRRNHMKYLFHKRDKTVYQGIRTEEFSLNACVACHAAKDDSGHFVPVTEEGQFCQTCHQRVSQKLDCFSCHRTTPES